MERGEGFPAYRLVPIPRDRFERFTEVLDLYCASQTQTERIRLKEKESLAHQRSVVNAGEMFQLSYTGFLEVLSAEERYLDSELEHIDIVTDLCRKKILLYRALGGGC